MIVSLIKDVARLCHDSRNVAGFLDIHQAADVLKLLTHSGRSAALSHLGDQGLGITDKLNSILHATAEKSVELVATPLDAVLNLVREVAQCAHRDRIFVLRIL